jgi:flagellar biosynthetic protein FliR
VPNIYNFNENEIIAFALILFRVSAFIVVWPILGTSRIPNQIKILFALSITFVFYSLIKKEEISNLDNFFLIYLSIKEVVVGVILGFLVRIIFFCFQVAGEIISISIGLSNAQVFNPQLSSTETHMTRLMIVMVTIFYLSVNGHHYFIQAFAQSFQFFPITESGINLSVFINSIDLMKQVIEIGLKLSAPVLLSIFLINISMAVLGKAVPQINVLITSLPVNIFVGYLVLIIVIPVLVNDMNFILHLTSDFMFKFVKGF